MVGAFGKNEHVMQGCRALSIAIIGLVLARGVDPITSNRLLGLLQTVLHKGEWIKTSLTSFSNFNSALYRTRAVDKIFRKNSELLNTKFWGSPLFGQTVRSSHPGYYLSRCFKRPIEAVA